MKLEWNTERFRRRSGQPNRMVSVGRELGIDLALGTTPIEIARPAVGNWLRHQPETRNHPLVARIDECVGHGELSTLLARVSDDTEAKHGLALVC